MHLSISREPTPSQGPPWKASVEISARISCMSVPLCVLGSWAIHEHEECSSKDCPFPVSEFNFENFLLVMFSSRSESKFLHFSAESATSSGLRRSIYIQFWKMDSRSKVKSGRSKIWILVMRILMKNVCGMERDECSAEVHRKNVFSKWPFSVRKHWSAPTLSFCAHSCCTHGFFGRHASKRNFCLPETSFVQFWIFTQVQRCKRFLLPSGQRFQRKKRRGSNLHNCTLLQKQSCFGDCVPVSFLLYPQKFFVFCQSFSLFAFSSSLQIHVNSNNSNVSDTGWSFWFVHDSLRTLLRVKSVNCANEWQRPLMVNVSFSEQVI